MLVRVVRGAGDSMAPEMLFDPLCTTQAVCTDKGVSYLYDEGLNKRIYEVSIPYRGVINMFDRVALFDSSLGESFVGRVIAHQVVISNDDGAVTVISSITIERSIEKE